MRIVHTSDWHAGRSWKGIDRLPELEAVLAHLAAFVRTEGVDLLLVTGDVFDTHAPAAKAERAVFRFFKSVGVPTVVIAGNHDSAARLEAWGELTEIVGVQVVARPCPADRGGVREIVTRTGERAVVAAVPFAAPRTLVGALELTQDETVAVQKYATCLGAIFAQLCGSFRADAVNVLAAHTHLDGALFNGSERKVHLGDDWAATAQLLPSSAHYVALGHIHKPQQVAGPSPALYAGSPLQLDFGEAGEEKSFVVIDASPGVPAKIRRVPYVGGVPLRVFRGTLDAVEARIEDLSAGHLKVILELETPDPEANRKVRRWLPNVVAVDVVLPEQEASSDAASRTEVSPIDAYRAWWRGTKGGEVPDEVTSRFAALLAEVPS